DRNPKLLTIIMGISNSTSTINRKLPSLAGQVYAYNQVMKKHQGESVVFLDMEAIQQEMGDHFLHPDGHHFSAAGHVWIADRLCEVVEARLGAAVGTSSWPWSVMLRR